MNEETKDKLIEMKYTVISDNEVIDRTGKTYYPRKSLLPLKAIRLHCAFCQGLNINIPDDAEPYIDIENCRDPLCPLYEHRLFKI